MYTYHKFVNPLSVRLDLIPERSFLVQLVVMLPTTSAVASRHVRGKVRL